MKKILLITTLFFAVQVQSQDTTKKTDKLTVKQVYEDAKTGFKDAFAGMKELAAKLEGPAKHVYGVYIQQHRTRGLVKLISSSVFILLFGGLLIGMWKPANFGVESSDDFNRHALFFIISSLGLAITIVSMAFYFSGDFSKLLNPEYYAIQDVINAFK